MAKANGYASREDVLEVGKVIHDEIMEEVKGIESRFDQSLLKSVKGVQGTLNKELAARVKELEERLEADRLRQEEKHRAEMFLQRKHYEEKIESLEKLLKSADGPEAGLDLAVRVGKMLEDKFDRKLAEFQKAHENTVGQLIQVIKALPTPQVILPEAAIRVEQVPSQVSVSVPEKAIQIHQVPSQVSVTVPEKAIEVKQLPAQVTLPEKAIQVHVQQAKSLVLEQPKRKTVTSKSILYDAETGRPAKIVEEVEES